MDDCLHTNFGGFVLQIRRFCSSISAALHCNFGGFAFLFAMCRMTIRSQPQASLLLIVVDADIYRGAA